MSTVLYHLNSSLLIIIHSIFNHFQSGHLENFIIIKSLFYPIFLLYAFIHCIDYKILLLPNFLLMLSNFYINPGLFCSHSYNPLFPDFIRQSVVPRTCMND